MKGREVETDRERREGNMWTGYIVRGREVETDREVERDRERREERGIYMGRIYSER